MRKVRVLVANRPRLMRELVLETIFGPIPDLMVIPPPKSAVHHAFGDLLQLGHHRFVAQIVAEHLQYISVPAYRARTILTGEGAAKVAPQAPKLPLKHLPLAVTRGTGGQIQLLGISCGLVLSLGELRPRSPFDHRPFPRTSHSRHRNPIRSLGAWTRSCRDPR